MKNLKFATLVDGYYLDVMKRFDRTLFEALAPPLVPFNILKFTGSETGDIVHLQFGKLFGVEWISKITDHGSDAFEAFFVDEGIKLPFPLKYWHHRHIVKKESETQSWIIDDITYEANNSFLTRVMYPVLKNGFGNRDKAYKKFFQQIAQETNQSFETHT